MAENSIVRSLWIGAALGPVERLSIASFLAHGHRFELFTYGPVAGVPEGTVTREADEILPQSEIFRFRDSYAKFSDGFRYEMLNRLGGFWADTDVICLQPFDFAVECVFAWEDPDKIGSAVLRLPPGHSVLRELIANAERPSTPLAGDSVWIAFEKLKNRVRGRNRRSCPVRREVGPKILTKVLRKHEMTPLAQPSDTFFPISWRSWRDPFKPGLGPQLLREIAGSHALHVWKQMIDRNQPPATFNGFPEGSLLGLLMKRYSGEGILSSANGVTV